MNTRDKQWYVCVITLVCFVVAAAGHKGHAAAGTVVPGHYLLPESAPEDFADILCRNSMVAALELKNRELSLPSPCGGLFRIVQGARGAIEGADTPEALIECLNRYLFEDVGLTYDFSHLFRTSPEAVLFNEVIEKKKGNCLGLSLIYLAVAEKLGLPVYGVVVPEHFFVRYDDGRVRINIETTRDGAALSDAYYRNRYGRTPDTTWYHRSLRPEETNAFYVSVIALLYKEEENYGRAIEIMKNAMRIIPESSELRVNLGNAYERQGKILRAIEQYHEAIERNPRTAEAYYNLGLVYFQYTRQYALARRYGILAMKMGCPIHPRYKEFLTVNN